MKPWLSSTAASLLVTLTTSLAGALALFLAGWKVERINRKELLESTAEWRQEAQDRNDLLEERDKRLVELKEQIEQLEASNARIYTRVEILNKEIVNLAAERLRRDRHITRLCRLLREKGVEPPLLEE